MSIIRMNVPDFGAMGAVVAEAARPLYERYVVPSYARSLSVTRGAGSWIWDEDGKKYLDLGGGVAVNCLGHAHPRIVETLQQQASTLIHASNLYHHRPQGQLAARLVALTGEGKVFFCNSGAEANEALIKLSRRFGHPEGRFEIITALNSFHGRTMAGISATGQAKVKETFEPLLPGFTHVPYNDLAAIESALTPRTVAVLIEGIQGEGGVQPARADYLLGLRELTRKHGLLLLWDGVQCGCFRTGHFHSYQTILQGLPGGADFLPDGIAMAKSLGGGFPIGAAWIRAPYADLFQPGSHGSTFGGTPLACAVALAVLDEIEEKGLASHVVAMGKRLTTGLEKWKATKPIVEIRGVGGLIGMALSEDAPAACARLRSAGLLTVPATGNVLRFLPPFNVTPDEIDQALAMVEKAL
ncbi:MAG: aspartate aminotransferase family protein [Candidatus Methylacidiphilales bacterium]|nr:aspartate aminotransferase family protein [Candidatus Methylacidiphilales bacterium]